MPQYVLDTNILLAYIRWQDLGKYIEATYQLNRINPTPIISVVTEAEIQVLATRHNWTGIKQRMLTKTLDFLTIVPIPYRDIIEAYVEIDDYSQRNGYIMGKNDVWTAALTKVEAAILLTTDRDFDHLHPHIILREYISPNSKILDPNPG